jgi:hypothetical protein
MYKSLKSMVMGPRVHNHSTPKNNVTTPHFNGKHVGFQRIITNLKAHIFTMTPTFHGTSISNHDLKVVDCMDIEMGLLRNSTVNKVMGVSTVDEDNDLMMLDIAN